MGLSSDSLVAALGGSVVLLTGVPILAGERGGGRGLSPPPRIIDDALSISTDIGSKYANCVDQRSEPRAGAVLLRSASGVYVPAIVRGGETCFSSGGFRSWLDGVSLLTLSLWDKLVRLELKDHELDAVLMALLSSLIVVMDDGDFGVCVLDRSPRLASLSSKPMVPFERSRASSAVQSLRVTSSMSLRKLAAVSSSECTVRRGKSCWFCIARSSLLSTFLLSPAACKTSISSGRIDVSSSASSASSSLLRRVRTLLASGL
jgi:hypothetical protein